jgi:ribulose kinase
MAAAAAAGLHPGLAAAARAMGGPPEAELAPDPAAAARLARDRRILAETRAHLVRVRALEATLPDAAAETFRKG